MINFNLSQNEFLKYIELYKDFVIFPFINGEEINKYKNLSSQKTIQVLLQFIKLIKNIFTNKNSNIDKLLDTFIEDVNTVSNPSIFSEILNKYYNISGADSIKKIKYLIYNIINSNYTSLLYLVYLYTNIIY